MKTLEQWRIQLHLFSLNVWTIAKIRHRLNKRYDEDYDEHVIEALNEHNDAVTKWIERHPQP